MFYDASCIETHSVLTGMTKILIAVIIIAAILIAAILMPVFWMFEASVKSQAYDYGYEQTNNILYSNPDIALSKQAIRFARALTGSTDPVYDACIERYPHKFVTEQLNGLAKTLFGDEALEWVIDGIDDAFDEFLGERK